MEQVARRQALVEADLTCLMCGRLIGQLAGVVSRGEASVPPTPRWSSFRPASAQRPGAVFTAGERLRCPECGGAAILEAMSVTSVHEPAVADRACPIHRDRMVGRGRRPRGCLCNDVQIAA